MDQLEAKKAELAKFSEELVCMKARLIAAESELEEWKRVISDFKAIAKKADDLVNVVIEAVLDNDQNVDQETMGLIEEAIRDLNEALNDVQSRGSRPGPADGGNA